MTSDACGERLGELQVFRVAVGLADADRAVVGLQLHDQPRSPRLMNAEHV
jgi:hypothetical protein